MGERMESEIGRAVPGQFLVKKNTNGTTYVEGLLQPSGSGERRLWRGYINTKENVVRTIEQLKAMGLRPKPGMKWADLESRSNGIGSIDCTWKLERSGQYINAVFVRPVRTLKESGQVPEADLAKLDRTFNLDEMFDEGGADEHYDVDADDGGHDASAQA